MARAKQSRKGKKEWRRNISTKEHEVYLDRSGRDERSGGVLDDVPSDSLFFVDKAKAPSKKLRKVDLARMKTLHSDSILQRSSLVPPVPTKAPRPKKDYLKPRTAPKAGPGAPEATRDTSSKEKRKEASLADIWPEEDLGGLKGEAASTEPAKPPSKRRRPSHEGEAVHVAAVEVDQPGCSFNPAFEEHQDALAEAVAAEVVKEAKKELQPQAPPLEMTAEGAASHAAEVELEMYAGLEALLPDAEPRDAAAEAGPDAGSEQEEDAADVAPAAPAKPVRVQKLTRADLNRRIRRREQEAALAAKQKRKRLNRDTDRVAEIATELQEQEDETDRRRQRREVAKLDKRKDAPPRLGKHRFEPEPVNVMLTEELTGSLRQVKGSFTLVRDRFKSFQKRGLVEPRVPVQRKPLKHRSRRIVEMGSKGRLEREMHAEILQMRAARKSKKGDVLAME